MGEPLSQLFHALILLYNWGLESLSGCHWRVCFGKLHAYSAAMSQASIFGSAR